MLNIKDYLLEYERKVPNILIIWGIILAFITIFILIINYNFKIIDYYQINGIIKGGSINILVPIDRVNSIVDTDFVYVNSKRYTYKVKEISNIINENNNFYQNIILDINFNDKIFIENNIMEVKFIINKETILKYIYNLIKGED